MPWGSRGGTLPGPGGGGYPARSSRGGYPGGGYPGGGYPAWGGTLVGGTLPGGYPVRTMGNTCYTAGGMPLAFMQEDFLVWFWNMLWCGHWDIPVVRGFKANFELCVTSKSITINVYYWVLYLLDILTASKQPAFAICLLTYNGPSLT